MLPPWLKLATSCIWVSRDWKCEAPKNLFNVILQATENSGNTWDIKHFVPAIKLDFLFCQNFDYVLDFTRGKQKQNSVQILFGDKIKFWFFGLLWLVYPAKIKNRFCPQIKIWTEFCFCFCFCPSGEIKNLIKNFTKELNWYQWSHMTLSIVLTVDIMVI